MVESDDDSLRARLVAAKLAGRKYNSGDREGYHFRTNEIAADVAVKVAVEWMREKAQLILDNFPDEVDTAIATAIIQLAETEIPEDEEDPLSGVQDGRYPDCVERWPECFLGGYDPRCCRFPKSCSCS